MKAAITTFAQAHFGVEGVAEQFHDAFSIACDDQHSSNTHAMKMFCA